MSGGPFQNLLAADFNGDGRQDLLAANGTSQPVFLFLNSDAGLQPPIVMAGGAGENDGVTALAAGDLDGDGLPDAVLVLRWQGVLVFVRGSPRNGLDGPTELSPLFAANPDGVAIADFVQDGRPDLVASGFSLTNAGALVVWLGGSPPNLPPPIASGYFGPIAAGRVNGDRWPDVVGVFQGALRLFANDAGTGFDESIISAPVGASGLTVCDVNADGWPDVAFGLTDGTSFGVLFSDGGQLLPWNDVGYSVAGPVSSLYAGDLDGDGSCDVLAVFAHPLGGLAAQAWFGGSSDNLTPGPQFWTDAGISVAQVSDLDGRGRPSIVYVDPRGVWRTEGTAAARLVFPGPFGEGGLTVLDVNGDGVPDLVGASPTTYGLLVILGAGDGGYSSTSAILPSSLGETVSPFTADFDGDGRPDFLGMAGVYPLSIRPSRCLP